MNLRGGRRRGAPAQAGYTLVELMVASTILAMSITATATMLRAGQDLEYKKNLERQAYRLAYSALENPSWYGYTNYNTMAGSIWSVELNQSQRPVNAVVTVTVHPEQKEDWPPYNSTFWKRVDAKVGWTAEGARDSVVVTKLVAEVK